MRNARVVPGYAFLVAFAIVLVSVIDPYSGAFAAPNYELAGAPTDHGPGQKLSASSADVQGARDGYTWKEKPKPKPVWTPPAAAAPDPGTAQAYALSAVLARGWPESEYGCLYALWQKESHWNAYSHNVGSGA